MTEKKQEVINFSSYNPKDKNSIAKAGKSDRECIRLIKCCNKENCDAFKKGKCILKNPYLIHQKCPYGKKEVKEGFTKAAKGCGEMVEKYRKFYSKIGNHLEKADELCIIGNYVYLNLPFLTNVQNDFRNESFFYADGMIRKSDFTPELIKELFEYIPQRKYGATKDSEIKSYQNKHLPAFAYQLNKNYPDLYAEVRAIYPDIDKYKDSLSFIGKNAKILTLNPGKVKIDNNIVYWDGKYIIGNSKEFDIKGLSSFNKALIIPNEYTIVEIADDNTVNDNTIFI